MKKSYRFVNLAAKHEFLCLFDLPKKAHLITLCFVIQQCVTALNKTWHPEHFFCAMCNNFFGEKYEVLVDQIHICFQNIISINYLIIYLNHDRLVFILKMYFIQLNFSALCFLLSSRFHSPPGDGLERGGVQAVGLLHLVAST